MTDGVLLDSMFLVAFLTGLALSIVLPVLGAFLRMRGEWLAAFGLAQVAAAGGVASIAVGVPAMVTATAAAAGASALRELLPRPDNSHYALMVLLGWCAALLLAGNLHGGHVLGESLLRGQLYFSHSGHLVGAIILTAVVLLTLPWLQPRLLRERFFPDWFTANGVPAWPHRYTFATLLVFAAVLSTIAMGAFPAFAMFFVPPWVAFRIVTGWRRALACSVGLGVAGYALAFFVALVMDQPFGPVLAAAMVGIAGLRLFARDVR